MKRIVSIFLVFILCVTIVTPVFASDIKHFNDLTGKEYYYKYVTEMISKGVVNGYEDDTFGPNKNITWAEALAMILRGAKIYVEHKGESPWYDSVQKWFISNGVLTGKEDLNKIIDRENVVKVLDLLYSVPDYSGKSKFSDTSSNTINKFYIAGIINGYEAPTANSLGKFAPKENIRRGDFCIILSNVINNFNLKENINKEKDEYEVYSEKSYLTLYDLPIFECPNDCLSAENIAELMRWMVQNELSKYTLSFSCDVDDVKNLEVDMPNNFRRAYFNLERDYYYLFYDKGYSFSVEGSYLGNKADVEVTVELVYSERSKRYTHSENIAFFEDLLLDMVTKNEITDNTSIKDKAKAAYQYIDYNFSYDINNLTPLNKESKEAVCIGYTVIFDYMMKRLGIKSQAISGETKNSQSPMGGHIWNAVRDEKGDWYYCDATWGDAIPDGGYGHSDLSWFWLTEKELMTKDTNRRINKSY